MDSELEQVINDEVIQILGYRPYALTAKDIYQHSQLAPDIATMHSVLGSMKALKSIIKLADGRFLLQNNLYKYQQHRLRSNNKELITNTTSQKKENNTESILMSLTSGPKTSDQIADATDIDINIVWKILSRLRNQDRIEREERSRKQGNLYSLSESTARKLGAKPSSEIDPVISGVETSLIKSVRGAQEALDIYLASESNDDIAQTLRNNIRSSRRALDTWRETHATA
ncbi:MAG: hypothetical protein FVQ79_00555 [Planctomycetes bacterium]|nr:hypothetical protein [Planctomycetota bacterium]